MKKEQTSKTSIIEILRKIFPAFLQASPVLFLATQMTSLISGLSMGITTVFTQRLFDKATLLSKGEATVQQVGIALFVLIGIMVFRKLLQVVANLAPGACSDKTIGWLSQKMHQKLGRIAPVYFEDTKKLDDINKAEEGKSNAVWFVWGVSYLFSFYLPYFIFMSWYLFTVRPALVLALLAAFVPTAATQVIHTKIYAKLEDQSAPLRREVNAWEKSMVDRVYFKETRQLGVFRFLKHRFQQLARQMNQLRFHHYTKSSLWQLCMELITLSGYFGVLVLLFESLMQQKISVGAFAAVFASLGQVFEIMQSVLYDELSNLSKERGTIQNYLRFMAMPEREGTVHTLPEQGGIRFSGVSFCYPCKEGEEPKRVVDQVSFTIHEGETVAIVGENGSGKTTLARLIAGLYLPAEGKALLGGVDMATLDPRLLYRNTSAVFQKYQRYQMRLQENITISHPGKEAWGLAALCEQAGVELADESFPAGLETMLSREFDGVDLSGGQWQRVAIARSFFRDHRLMILDEPTAAIDPFEETRIYNRFAEIARDKTAVIITHRLGSVRLADRIFVMEGGRLTESVTHEELLAKGGLYTRLYQTQEKWYQ